LSTLEPTLGELVRRAFAAQMLEVHTALPAKVVTYYAADCTADVQIGPARAVPTVDGEVAYEKLPTLPRVPVLALGTSRSCLQVPLQPGDSVWLLFSEASAAEFLGGSDASQPGDLARFSMSSCLAIPFVRPGQVPGASPLALLSDVQAVINAITQASCGGSGAPLTWIPPTPTGTVELGAK
jgi:hypothetical protein